MTIMMLPSLSAKQGDVVLVLFSNSNLQTAKTRPALVVQSDNLQTGLSQVIVAMITSKLFRAGHPSRVLINLSSMEGQQSGLLADSVVMADNLATIIDSGIIQIIGLMPMNAVDHALQQTLGL